MHTYMVLFSLCMCVLTVFGVSLQTAVYRSQLGTDGIELPTVFRECIDYLEENGKFSRTVLYLPFGHV